MPVHEDDDHAYLIQHAQLPSFSPFHHHAPGAASQTSLDSGQYTFNNHDNHDNTLYELRDFSAKSDTSRVHVGQDRPDHIHGAPLPTSHSLWQPFWLRKTTLIGLAILFTALWIALIILWRFVLSENGISLRLTRNQYSWTYGPTAILVVVISLWRQVDYYCKLLSPWQNLMAGPASASNTILLDYVSLLQLNALFKAIRLRNYSVAISVLGFFLLKLTLIFSTGLFISTPTIFAASAPRLATTTKFDALAYNATLPAITQNYAPSIDDTGSEYLGNDVYTYFGIEFNGMNPLNGTLGDTAFQSYRQLGDLRNITNMTAYVDVFSPTTRCEIGNVTITDLTGDDFDPLTGGGVVTIQVDTPTCRLGHGNILNGSFYNIASVPKKNPRTEICAPRELTPDMAWMNCSTSNKEVAAGGVYDASEGDYRWLITLVDIRYNQTIESDSNSTSTTITSWSREVASVTAILCNVTYTMSRQALTYVYHPGSSVEAILTGIPDMTSMAPQLPGLTNTQLNQAVMGSLSSASTLFPMRRTGMGDLPDGRDTLFGLMDLDAHGDGSYESLLPATALQSAAEATINGISSVVAHNNLLFADSSDITGTMFYTEDRLHIRPLSLWFMVGLFQLMTAFSLLLILVRPYKVVPCNPHSLGASAAILHASDPRYQIKLSQLGHSRESVIRSCLRTDMFLTAFNDRFGISMIEAGVVDSSDDPARQKAGQWYPWALRYPVLLPTVVMPIIAIIVLEVLQRVSDAHDGIATVTTKLAENIYYYITALTMLLIATLFNNLDFIFAAFAPFSVMRSNSLPAKQSVTFHLIGDIPLVALWRTLRARHIGPTLSNLAGLIGSTLTIIASGLWLLDPNTLMLTDFSVQRHDLWNTTWNSYNNDSGAAVIYSLITHQNLSFPSWTYDELAFPKVTSNLSSPDPILPGTETSTSGGTLAYQFKLPALRANLNCSLIPADRITTSYFNASGSHPGSYIVGQGVTLNLPMPPECPAGLAGNESSINLTISAPLYDYPGKYMAQIYDLHTAQPDIVGESSTRSIPDNPAGCPSLAFALAYIRVNSTPAENVTGMICDQQLQELQTTVTLREETKQGIAEATIDADSPPIIDETSERLLTNGTAGVTAFQWRPEYNLRAGLQKVNQSASMPNPSDMIEIETFFDSIFNATGIYSPESYMRPDNAEKFINSINHAYRQYMAQVISKNMRVTRADETQTAAVPNLDNGADTSTTFAGSRSVATPRLKINRATKLALQICLAVMTLLGIVAYFLVNLRGVLAHNPCTIAGTMSLLAESELCEKIPKGSEFLSEKELDKYFEQSGFLYSLGWWESGSDTTYRGYASGQPKRFGIDIGRSEVH